MCNSNNASDLYFDSNEDDAENREHHINERKYQASVVTIASNWSNMSGFVKKSVGANLSSTRRDGRTA
jgi:hypothetical protein